jgi:hypothetical protein
MSSDNVSSFLNSIKELKKETVCVFIPSISEQIELTTLNLKQQKDIISCIADGVTGLVSFTRILNDIVISSSNRSDLTVIDRVPAIIALRINAHGTKYVSEDGNVDLNDILAKLDSYEPTSSKMEEFAYNGVVAKVVIPTLSYENSIITKLETEVKKNGEDNTKNLGSIYIHEIIKYIDSLEYNNVVIEFSSLSIKDKITVLESLPLPLNKQIINFIENIKRKERELLTINNVTVDISPGFFDAE